MQKVMVEGVGDRDDCGVPGSLPVKEAAPESTSGSFGL